MKFSLRSRALVIVAASASLLAVPLSMPASAAASAGKCTKLSTKTVGKNLTATLSNCTPKPATGGSGGGTFKSNPAKSGTLIITITWKGTGTTKATVKFGPATGLGKCPKGSSSRIKLTGTISGGTGVAVKTIKKGQAITGSVCAGKTSDTLEPGTALTY
jgi:hypothetical protein